MDKSELGSKIRTLRKSLKLSQEKLSEAAKIDRSSLQRIENAEVSPTVDTLWAIGVALNKKLNIEFGHEKPTKPELVSNVGEMFASIDRRLAGLEENRTNVSSTIPPKLWAAWRGAESEKWRQDIALFFLTGDPDEMTDAVPKELRKRLLEGLRFHKMTPKARVPKK